MAIALKGLLPKEECQTKDIGTRTEEAVMHAVEQVTEENQEWVAVEGYDDGGPAEFDLGKPKDASAAPAGSGAYRRGRGSGSNPWRGGRGVRNQERRDYSG